MSRGILQSIPTWMFSLALLLSATTNVNQQQLFHSFVLSLGFSVWHFTLSNSITAVGSPTHASFVCVCVFVYARLFGYVHSCICLAYECTWMCVFVSMAVCARAANTREAQQLFIYMGRTSRSSLQSVLQRFVRRSHALPLQKREIAQEICFCVIKTNNAVVKW